MAAASKQDSVVKPVGVIEVKDKWQDIAGYVFGYAHPLIVVDVEIRELEAGVLTTLKSSVCQILENQIGELEPNATEGEALLTFMLELIHALQKSANLPIYQTGKVFAQRTLGNTGVRASLIIPVLSLNNTFRLFQYTSAFVAKMFANLGEEKPFSNADLDHDIQAVVKILQSLRYKSINIPRILDAAYRAEIPVTFLTDSCLVLGYGARSRWLESTLSDRTSALGVTFARTKTQSSRVLRKYGLPAPYNTRVRTIDAALSAAHDQGYPVVIKPVDRDGGKGVHAGLTSDKEVTDAFKDAKRYSKSVLLEKHIAGYDYRLTVVHNELVKASYRKPGGVTGDGVSSIGELVANAQTDAEALRRERERGKVLFSLDEEAETLLQEAGMGTDSVPEKGMFVPLRRRANVSTGGTTEDVLDLVHPDNRDLALRAAQVFNLDFAGVDLIISDISRSWQEVDCGICEINAQPQIGTNHDPDLYIKIVQDMLAGDGRIPIILLFTMQQDSSASTLLRGLKQLLAEKVPKVAICNSEAGWLDSTLLTKKQHSIVDMARSCLLAKEVDAAVIEMPFNSVFKYGLPSRIADVLVLAAPLAEGELSANLVKTFCLMVKPHCSRGVVLDLAIAQADLFIEAMAGKNLILTCSQVGNPAMQQQLSLGTSCVWVDDSADATSAVLYIGTLNEPEPVMEFTDIADHSDLVRTCVLSAGSAMAYGYSAHVIRTILEGVVSDGKELSQDAVDKGE